MSFMPVRGVLRQNQVYVCLSCLLKESSRAGCWQPPYQNALGKAFSTTARRYEESNEVEGDKQPKTTRLQLLTNYVLSNSLGKNKHRTPPEPVHTREKSHSLLSASADPPSSTARASGEQEKDLKIEQSPLKQESSNNSRNVSKNAKGWKDRMARRPVHKTQDGPIQPSSTAAASNEQDLDPESKKRLLETKSSKNVKDASETTKIVKDQGGIIGAPTLQSLRTSKDARTKYLRMRRRRRLRVKLPATAKDPNVQDVDLEAEKVLPKTVSSGAVAFATQDVESKAEKSLTGKKSPKKSSSSKTAKGAPDKIPKTIVREVPNLVIRKHKTAPGDDGAPSVHDRSQLHSTDPVPTKAGKKSPMKKTSDVSSKRKEIKPDIEQITATDLNITGM